jgi:hypothetical protein
MARCPQHQLQQRGHPLDRFGYQPAAREQGERPQRKQGKCQNRETLDYPRLSLPVEPIYESDLRQCDVLCATRSDLHRPQGKLGRFYARCCPDRRHRGCRYPCESPRLPNATSHRQLAAWPLSAFPLSSQITQKPPATVNWMPGPFSLLPSLFAWPLLSSPLLSSVPTSATTQIVNALRASHVGTFTQVPPDLQHYSFGHVSYPAVSVSECLQIPEGIINIVEV